MSIEQQIRPLAQKIPYAEIVDISKNGWGSRVDYFEGMWDAEKGDVIKALLNVAVCRQVNIPDLELNKMVESIGRHLTGKDSVIVMHGPFAERAGGIPEIGHDNQYCGWHGTAENDVELTILSTLPSQVIRESLRSGPKSLTKETIQNGSAWYYKFSVSGWQKPSWNIPGTKFVINDFFTTKYSYFQNEYPAIDFHYANSPDPISEFITIYGNRYSNIFGQRFLVCFINSDGSLDQRIWQPVKPERQPKRHVISLVNNDILSMPWIIPEAVKMAIDTVRYTSIVPQEASIDGSLVEKISNALVIQASFIDKTKGPDWLREKANKKLETAYHRARLFDKNGGKEKINDELRKIGWFDAVGIKI